MLNRKAGVKQRESNIELFRIIIMFLIVAHHYIVNSGIYEQITELRPSQKLCKPPIWCKIEAPYWR